MEKVYDVDSLLAQVNNDKDTHKDKYKDKEKRNNQSVDKYFAKEVQATLPLTFYRYIFDKIDSQETYHCPLNLSPHVQPTCNFAQRSFSKS